MGSDEADLDEAVVASVQRVTMAIAPSRLGSQIELKHPPGTPEMLALGRSISRSYSYIHGNKLTGHIPPELGNMSKLSYLQLNDNELEGTIPAELGKLKLTKLFEL